MLKDIKVKTLITFTLGLLLMVLVGIGCIGLFSVREATTALKTTSMRDMEVRAGAERIRFKMEVNRSQILQTLQHNPAMEWHKMHDHPVEVHYKIIDDTTSEIKRLWALYYKNSNSAEERSLAEAWFATSGNLGVLGISDAKLAIQRGDWDEAQNVLIKRINPGYRVSDASLESLSEYLTEQQKKDDAAVAKAIGSTTNLIIATVIFAAFLAVAGRFILIRGIHIPLEKAIAIARRVASGDIGRPLQVESDNEIGQLLKALAEMDNNLAHIVQDVRTSTDSIATAAHQISAGNDDLARRTEAQASALAQTIASMEQITGSVRRNGENARQANQLAISAAQVAGKGGQVVSEVVETMSSINASSRKIVDIIGVIDGIAFQTNILALNAAVEAARAGEQGRGFAVVAGEVRNLAQRSASAAKEIKTLIDDSVDKVRLGTRLVDDAGVTMEEIVGSVNRVTDIMSEIAAAGQEQGEGIDHIDRAISQMDDVTQQNAALVEEAAAAAVSLEQQASSLVKLVSVFNVASGPVIDRQGLQVALSKSNVDHQLELKRPGLSHLARQA
ncbi:methyl-accepting chemotaxis protein [Massilia sp. KIM]|uniref:methyl-accepting chemotaxis protein n=1 Tax=Massilia sp. KIM TaxID=1955422 RepID=UPI00098F8535|nr:methyl-accepting chemotaxis protein [Massilia sp. KIM]